MVEIMSTAIVAILVFGLLVFFHELGHFSVAKMVGIRVHEFAIGMGPKLLYKKKHETLYSVRVFPIGGFVRMEGEDENSDAEDSFSKKTVLERMSVIFAGPMMNFILGFLCFFIIFFYLGTPSTTIGEIIPGSPAAQLGLQPNDIVIEIEGEYIDSWEELVSMIVASEGNPIEIVYTRDGNTITQPVYPEVLLTAKR